MSELTRRRRTFSAAYRWDAVRRHLEEGVPVSELCRELSIRPSQFESWLERLWVRGELVFSSGGARAEAADASLRETRRELARMQDAVADLVYELALRMRVTGEPLGGRHVSAARRDDVVRSVERWCDSSGLSRVQVLQWLGLSSSTYFSWKRQAQLDDGTSVVDAAE